MKGMMKVKLVIALLVVIAVAIFYYVSLPAINIHATETWKFIFLILAVLFVLYIVRKAKIAGQSKIELSFIKEYTGLKIGVIVFLLFLAVYVAGSILSSPIVNAAKYQKLLKVEEGEFTEDIKQISYDQIPLLDRDSASILGNRKMGSLVDMASQFEVSELYSQINYKGEPVRVTPLRYADTIKWLTNQKEGIPAYIKIDMATQDTELVRLSEGMKYTPYDHFHRNLKRHLRFRYPTYIFDDISFEIDEEGTPYWICSVADYKIGLFGGKTIGRVVLCNAVTGECTDYAVKDVPSWVDRVYSADLLVQLYDYYGSLKHGFINSVLGQKDCLTTTNGYNYLAMNDDVWVYTGVTSITSDQSNVGFVLMNERTMETKYYQVEGAIEDSAMSSAEGKVQNLGYTATFPLLLNITNEPTYFIALKDDSGLVKMYAMVNVQKYQIVATGDSVSECEKNYMELMKQNGVNAETKESDSVKKATGTIAKITDAVVEGNTHQYILLENDSDIYDASVVDYLDIVRYGVGDTITFEYMEGEQANTVLGIEK